LFGAGSQTTSLLYMVWHSGFALFVMAYARMRPAGIDAAAYGTARRKSARDGIARAVLAVLAMVLGITLIATVGERHIPEFIQGDRTTDLGHGVLAGVWLFSLLALWLLWRKRPHVVLDVWLMVVLCVWLFDIALAAMLNSGRYDVGWYVGRIYGLLSAGFLLLALLLEDSRQSARLVHMSIELDAANRALLELSRHDGLTSLANRRYFDEYLDEQIALAVRHKRGLALILCDVDHFKSYNDQYGHPAGDECLRRVGAALQSCCQRPADMAARYGGEEFALILPDTGTIGAAQVAEAVRTAIVAMNITHSASSTGPCVSVSGGVAILRVNAQNGASQLISDADKGMYMAKTQGRNRMHIQTA
jgi:diguanylate cyclase (GGDEF)-like protein